MTSVSTSIEIASSPEHVREVLLDFAKLPDWCNTWFKKIEPVEHKTAIEKGDKLSVELQGMKFTPRVLEHTPEQFKWRGSIPGLFNGDHIFRFEPSKTTPGSTTFTHAEEYSGVLAIIFKPFSFFGGDKQRNGFDAFNKEFKERCEGRR